MTMVTMVTSVTSPPSPELAADPVPSISSILTHLTIISPFLQSLRLFFLSPLFPRLLWCDLSFLYTTQVLLVLQLPLLPNLRLIFLTYLTFFITLLYFTLPHCHFDLPLEPNNLSTYHILSFLRPNLNPTLLPYHPIISFFLTWKATRVEIGWCWHSLFPFPFDQKLLTLLPPQKHDTTFGL